jgi:hypothetical protein
MILHHGGRARENSEEERNPQGGRCLESKFLGGKRREYLMVQGLVPKDVEGSRNQSAR